MMLRRPAGSPEGTDGTLDSTIRYRISAAVDLQGSAECLLFLLSGGFAIWQDGRLLEVRELVERLDGLKIVIYAREHAPAHFHVKVAGINASFAIDDCRLLNGEIPARQRQLIEYWYGSARLIAVWNSTRPTDCQVGPIRTSDRQ